MFIINNQKWDIKFVYSHDPILLTDNNIFTLGTCDSLTHTIYLANNITGALLKKVLCHEVVHAAMFSYNILLDYSQEELLANIISTYGEEIIIITNNIFKRLQ